MNEHDPLPTLSESIAALTAWAKPKLAEHHQAGQTHTYTYGDEITAPEGKAYLEIREGQLLLATGEETLETLETASFLRGLDPTSKLKLFADTELGVQCAWYSDNDLGLSEDETLTLQLLEGAFWRAVAEALAVEQPKPKTSITMHEPGAILIREGDKSDSVYEMIGGEAEVLVAGNIVGEIKTGEFFGEYTFLVEEPRSATVRAISHCTVQEVSAPEFEKLIQNRPQIILEMARELAKRLHSTNQKVDNLKTSPTKKASTGTRYRVRLRT